MNGARPTNNGLRVNGIDATNLLNASGGLGSNISIPLDALEEVEMQTALPSAARGRSPGGNVELITRAGSDRYSGSAGYYWQHESLNANEFFLNRGSVAKPKFRRNDSSATIGGPVRTNRTFFFGAVQRQSFTSGYATNANAAVGLPTTLTDVRTAQSMAEVANEWMRTGAEDNSKFAANFLTALKAFPAEQQAGLIAKFFADPTSLTFRQLTAADIHPVALNILNQKRDGRFLIPSPTTDLQALAGNGLCTAREYLLQQVVPTTLDGWSGFGSLQHRVGASNSSRLSVARSTQEVEESFGWADASPSPTNGLTPAWLAGLTNQHVLAPASFTR